MKIKEALKIIVQHQDWRTGADINPVKPKDLTEAINVAIKKMEDVLVLQKKVSSKSF